MTNAMLIILVAVPCAIGAWFWWSMNGAREMQNKHTLKINNKPTPKALTKSPHTFADKDFAISFRVGCRYYDSSKNRVFECIALKGKKARLAAFGCLDTVESDLAFLKNHPEFGGFHKVRIDSGVETCERGTLRADRHATEKEISEELKWLKKLRESKG